MSLRSRFFYKQLIETQLFAKMYNVRRYFLNRTSTRQILFMTMLSMFSYQLAFAQVEHPELERVRGFDDYKMQRQMNDREREKGLALHLERIEMERREYEAALQEHRKVKRKEKPLESTPSYKENVRDRERDKQRRIAEQEEFIADKKVERRRLNQAKINKLEELGLPEDRPRFDIKKRTLYGAASPFDKAPPSTGGGGSNSFAPSDGGFPMPPPAQFDEFPPPPTFPGDDNFDLPPPPPPPMPYDEGMGMNNPPFDEFPPPPPPPGDDFQF